MEYLNRRIIARITLEAQTALCISEKPEATVSNAQMARDVNGLPYIPASTLAGVIGKEVSEVKEMKKEKTGRLLFTDALLVGEQGKPKDGLLPYDVFKGKKGYVDVYFSKFDLLPVRFHIWNRTTSYQVYSLMKEENNEEVVYKGSRFVFEMELWTSDENDKVFDAIIKRLRRPLRVGRGSRRGLGKVVMHKCLKAELDLRCKKDREAYAKRTGRLDKDWDRFEEIKEQEMTSGQAKKSWHEITLTLRPRDFFLFGGMTENDKSEAPFAEEFQIKWTEKETYDWSSREQLLIAASAVKGALRHRTAYHYARELMKDKEQVERNEIDWLFGTMKKKKEKGQERGRVLFSDVYIDEKSIERQVLNHCGVDRLTGIAMDRSLFDEQVVRFKKPETALQIEILVSSEIDEKEKLKNAFKATLEDLCNGRLSLGRDGGQGMGFFEGEYEIKKNRQ